MPIQVADGYVVKRRSRLDLAQREYDKTSAAYKLAANSGLFSVPKPLCIDLLTGEMRFEHLRGYVPLRAVMAQAEFQRNIAIVERLADILRLIHGALPLSPERSSEAWPGSAPGDEFARPLHGDFTIDNVMFDPRENGLAVVDWSSASWLQTDSCTGPVAIDLFAFLLSLYNQKVWQRLMISSPEDSAVAFLRRYRLSQGPLVDRSLYETSERHIVLYVRALSELPGFSKLLYRPSIAKLRRLVRHLFLEGSH